MSHAPTLCIPNLFKIIYFLAKYLLTLSCSSCTNPLLLSLEEPCTTRNDLKEIMMAQSHSVYHDRKALSKNSILDTHVSLICLLNAYMIKDNNQFILASLMFD